MVSLILFICFAFCSCFFVFAVVFCTCFLLSDCVTRLWEGTDSEEGGNGEEGESDGEAKGEKCLVVDGKALCKKKKTLY